MPHPQLAKTATLLAALLTLAACTSNGGTKTTPAAANQAAIDKAQADFQAQSKKQQSGMTKDGQFVLPEGDDAPKNLYDPSKPRLSTDQIKLDQPRDPKAELERRVIERWALLIAKQGDLAFDYLTPGYRQAHDRATYQKEMADRPVKWYRVLYSSAECASEDNCQVGTMVYFKIRMSAATGLTDQFGFVHERWLRIDGTWYFLPEETAL